MEIKNEDIITIPKDKLVLLNNEWAVKFTWNIGRIDLTFRIFAKKLETSWKVNVQVTGENLDQPSIEKDFLQNVGQRLMIGYYESSVHMRSYNQYVNLMDLLQEKFCKEFTPKNAPLCELNCVANGVLLISPCSQVQVFSNLAAKL